MCSPCSNRASPPAAQRAAEAQRLPIDPAVSTRSIIMAELAGHWAAGTPMAETPWLHDAAQAAQRCEEAVAAAVEACAEDTAGQTCFICLEDGSDEGLVRGCSCRGGNGFAHMSCLAEQARRSHTAANQRRWDPDGFKKSWSLWHTCGQCKQHYHGVVKFALGWACWKTYVGQPEYLSAMHSLAHGLYDMGNYEDALTAYKAELFVLQRHGRVRGTNSRGSAGRCDDFTCARRSLARRWPTDAQKRIL